MRDNHMSWFARKRGLRLLPALGNLFPFGSVYNLYKITYNNYLLFIIYNFPRHAQLQSSIFTSNTFPAVWPIHQACSRPSLLAQTNSTELGCRCGGRGGSSAEGDFRERPLRRARSLRHLGPYGTRLPKSCWFFGLITAFPFALLFYFVVPEPSVKSSMEGSSNFHISQFWL